MLNDKETGFDYDACPDSIVSISLIGSARYYNNKLGIWMSVDPLKGKYPSFTPYNYCFNNPVRLFDPSGMFPADIHALVICSVYKERNIYLELAKQALLCDWQLANVNQEHFDNFDSYEQVNNLCESRGGFLNLSEHTIGDFYAHSNYVNIWTDFLKSDEGKKYTDADMPAFENMGDIPAFDKIVKNELQTTTWKKGETDRDHDNGTRFKSKDTADKNDPKSVRLYKLAIKGYVKSLKNRKAEEDKKEKKKEEKKNNG